MPFLRKQLDLEADYLLNRDDQFQQLRRAPDVEVNAVVHVDQPADLFAHLGFTDAFVDQPGPLLEMLQSGALRPFGEIAHHMLGRGAGAVDVERETFVGDRQIQDAARP